MTASGREQPSGAATDVSKTKKVERLRFAKAAPRSILGREAAELDQASLVRTQRECELLHPLLQCCLKALGTGLVLEAATLTEPIEKGSNVGVQNPGRMFTRVLGGGGEANAAGSL